jgi:hypothetical protein
LHAFVVANGERPAIFLLLALQSRFSESGSMALHRDIYWVGKQWAVTGFGVQAIDQRLTGAFDIEVSRLFDDELPARLRGFDWVNGEDLDRALGLARARFAEPAKEPASLVDSVLELIQQPAPAPKPQPAPPPAETGLRLGGAPVQAELPRPAPLPLQLHMQGKLARFLPQWRIRR